MRIRLNRDRLLALIAESHLSQNHWAMRLGLSRGHWSNIVNGKHPYPSARTRQLLVEAFGVAVDDLFVVEASPSLPEPSFQAALGDRYLIDREVGQGGMGTVHLARDVKLGRVVAIKVIAPEAVSGIGVVRFLREVGYVARLQHPHIVPLYEAGDAAGSPYFVMPWFRDGSLRDLLARRRRLPMSDALPVLRGVAAALVHAHAHQVLHCDIKPGNVLLAGPHAYVADFGVARAIRSEALEWGPRPAPDSSAGTPAYVSPEQAAGEPDLDGRSDLYSFACVAFELLAGRPPFEGRTTLEIVARRFTAEVPEVRAHAPDVPAAVSGVIARGMAVDRDDRPASIGVFLHELDRAARGRLPAITVAARRAVERGARAVGRKRIPDIGGRVGTFGRELRLAARSLVRQPAIALTAALTLALGIGATAAIFSVVSGILLQPLPYDAPGRIVQIWNPWSNEPGVLRGRSSISSADFADAREAVAGLEAIAAYDPQANLTLTGADMPERVPVSAATAGLFLVLGAGAALGRTFTPDEDVPGRGDVVVLSHELWQRRFGGEQSVLDRVVRFDNRPFRVVGVMPPGFRLPIDYTSGSAAQAWIPLALDEARLDRGYQWLHVLGRLAPGASLASVNTELEALTRRWIDEGFKIRDLPPYYAVPVREEAFGNVRGALLILLGAVGFVLLIACANVSNLLLARAEGRRTEMALRSALGAGRGRIVAQLLTESLLLALLGGAAGLLLAQGAVAALQALDPSGVPRIDEIRVDLGTLGFTALVVLAATVLFGLAPALSASRRNLIDTLKTDTRAVTAGRARRRVRAALVSVQLGLAVVLVIGAALLVRTFAELSRVDLGFEPDRVLTFEVPPPATAAAFLTALTERLATLPGVRAVGAARALPLAAGLDGGSVALEGVPPPRTGEGWPNARWQIVTPGYFEAMRITLAAGRLLEPADRADGVPVVVVNETMASAAWPGESALGKRLRNTNRDVPWFTVVGVVRDVRHGGVVPRPSPTAYFLHGQFPLTRSLPPATMSYAVRTVDEPLRLAGAVRDAVRSVDPAVPVTALRPMRDVVSDALAPARFTMLLLAIFAGVALVLATVGIYGLLSYSVSRRGQEIGIRTALGATSGAVLGLVMRDGLRLVLAGLVTGLVAAFLLTRLLAGLLYGVEPLDPVTFVAVPLLFGLVAAVATYVPARRAMAVDPVMALRQP